MRLSRKKIVISITLALSLNQNSALAQFDPIFELSDLNGQNGFALNGSGMVDRSGRVVSAAGDINGDGISDLIIGAYRADPNGVSDSGSSYVVFGSAGGLPNPFPLGSTDGNNGFVINGVAANDRSGIAVSSAGDVNGDGVDDVIIGADFADGNSQSNAGTSYVVFGSATNLPSTLDLAGLNGQNGFVLNGSATDDNSGKSVSAAGDINGDGIDDIIIGASNADPNQNSKAGSSYVVFGFNDPLTSSISLSSLNTTTGFIINGEGSGDRVGYSVSAAGDFNADGFDDLIIGAPYANNIAGVTYLIFGSDTGLPNPFNLDTVDGQNGIEITGIGNNDLSGRSVSAAGDVNGDGIDDVIIGADFADPNGVDNAGSSYVVFGTNSGLPSPFSLSSLDGTNGFTINGMAENDRSGWSVDGAGDINADGIDDLIIGAFTATTINGNVGSSYVVFGTSGPQASILELSALDGMNGFAINGVADGDRSGISVSGAGDINGDGIDDLIIGAYGADPAGNPAAGSSYVVFGNELPIFKDGFE